MEVICERCHTEYEFDDALVSERGTTVKCTNCGHQFRIFRKGGQATPERWVVRLPDNQELVFTSIRDLQRAITRGRVAPRDVLLREGMSPRKLEDIAELEPFFRSTSRSAKPPAVTMPRGPMNTAPGLGGPGSNKQVTVPMSEADAEFEEKTIPRFTPSTDGLPPKPSSPSFEEISLVEDKPIVQKTNKPLPAAGRKPVVSKADKTADAPKPEPKPAKPEPEPAKPEPKPAKPEPEPARKDESSSETESKTSSTDDMRASSGILTPTPPAIRSARYEDDGMTDPRFLSTPPRATSSNARWIVALVLVGGLAVLALTVGRNYLPHPSAGHQQASAKPGEGKVSTLLEAGKAALRRGDIDEANASFVKASALDDGNAEIQLELARIASIKADMPWLRLQLLDKKQDEIRRITQQQLDSRTRQALKTSAQAMKAAPSSMEAIATRIDALRAAGKLEDARALVGRLTEQGTDPKQAYAAAMLQAAEEKPSWNKVVEHLRVAVTGDERLSRSLGALIFALAKDGNIKEAKTYMGALEKLKRPFPLIVELRKLVGEDAGEPKDAGAAEHADAEQKMKGAGGASGALESTDSYQVLMDKAHRAHRAGQLDKAERLYRQVLAKNPGDTEALAGLGDIAKARGDTGAAMGYYNQVAKGNPSYLPALVGLADSKWASGDHQGAVKLYKQIVQQTGGMGSYGQHAKQRISQANAESKAATPAGSATSSPTPTATDTTPPAPTATTPPAPTATTPPAPKDTSGSGSKTPPGIDTSDLPGWSP